MNSRALIFVLLLCVATSVAQEGWRSYRNERFGYTLELPEGLLVSNRPVDGSGVTWQTGTVKVQVSGANNPYKIKPHEYFERVRASTDNRIVFEKQGTDAGGKYWYELLYTARGRRIHQKVYVGSGGINTVLFSYAYRYREDKEHIGQQVIDSFRPGMLTVEH